MDKKTKECKGKSSNDQIYNYDKNYVQIIETEIQDIMNGNESDDSDLEAECEKRFGIILDKTIDDPIPTNNNVDMQGEEWNIPVNREELIDELRNLCPDGFPISGLEYIKDLASKTFEDKISQLQFQLANKSIKGRKALSDDEFEWLLKHIEEDEEFDMIGLQSLVTNYNKKKPIK